jgi:hypothetical protein
MFIELMINSMIFYCSGNSFSNNEIQNYNFHDYFLVLLRTYLYLILLVLLKLNSLFESLFTPELSLVVKFISQFI